MFGSSYRRFAPHRLTPLARGAEVLAEGDTVPLRLDADDLALAQLFDGQRDATSIRQAAREQLGRGLSAGELEGFAAELCRYRLLRPGTHEPLPVPVHTLEQAHALGWTGREPAFAATTVQPPSTVPGSLAAPGLIGGLTGLIGTQRGAANRIDLPLYPQPLVWLGRSLIWPLASRWSLGIFLLLLVAGGFGLYGNRYDAIGHVTDLMTGYRPLFGLLLGVILVNLFASAARAAAIAHYTPERVQCGLVFGFLGLPRVFVDTGGAAEHSGRVDRLRIVGAGLVGVAALLALCMLIWFLGASERPLPATAAIAVMAVCAGTLFIQLNPLTKRDGYFLLAHWLNAPDLREQSLIGVFGIDRPWFNQARKLPKRVLRTYGIAIGAYWIFVVSWVLTVIGGWLADHFSGNGFLVLMMVMGAYMYRQFNKAAGTRSNLGWKRNWMPSRRSLWIGAGVLLLCLIPYRYEPSGEFVVLPQARADVRALVSGDVREILIEEGDTVKAGDVIARLSDDEQRARVASSKAKLAQLRADLSLARSGGKAEEVEVAKQRVETARKRAEVARTNANRLAQAYSRRAVTAQEYEHARGASDVAAQELVEAERSLDLVSSPAVSERIQAIEAQIEEAEATLAYNEQELKNTRVTAPIGGRVVSRALLFAIGNYLNRGELLAVVEDSAQRQIEIMLPETGIGEVKPDNHSYAKVWAYPGTTFRGSVSSISPAAEEGKYGKVVRVYAVVEDPDDELKSGMTGNAKVQGEWHLAIVVFTRALMRFLFVEVWSWLP
jgi:putative peptide zinc metalloprotease protein